MAWKCKNHGYVKEVYMYMVETVCYVVSGNQKDVGDDPLDPDYIDTELDGVYCIQCGNVVLWED